jgi:uncharacterized sulfatase
MLLLGSVVFATNPARAQNSPNILFCISDDQSFAHNSFMGARELSTPAIDQLANDGVVMANAYCTAPSCAPSRASVLTGRYAWQMQQGDLLYGSLPERYLLFTKLLQDHGYFTGITGKGYAPANQNLEGFHSNPIGRHYNLPYENAQPEGLSSTNYTEGFKAFLRDKPADQPFFFWFGASEPHREYKMGIGRQNGITPANIEVPGFLPANEVVRNDMADYYYEIEWYDRHLGQMITHLRETGQLTNTIVIVTSDNGMPFPRAKASLYEYGVHVPFVIYWDQVEGNRILQDFISFADIAPTLLQAANIEIPETMTGKSFFEALRSGKSGYYDSARNWVVTSFERHVIARPEMATYPMRMIRKDGGVLIKNYKPDRWPAGNPEPNASFLGAFGDIDNSPSKTEVLLSKKTNKELYYDIAVGKRPAYELYNIHRDPYQLVNLASDKKYQEILSDLEDQLNAHLKSTSDPRMEGKDPWQSYPYYGKVSDTN